METEEKALDLALDEDALVSQVVEIISGIALGVIGSPEEPVEEEGDDSVFYDDEDQGLGDSREVVCCATQCRDGSPVPQKKNATGADVVQTDQELQTPKADPMGEYRSDPDLECNVAPEESVDSCGVSAVTPPEQRTPSGKGEEEEVELLEAHTPKIEPSGVFKEGRDTELNGATAEAPDQMSTDELQVSGESQDELDSPQDPGLGYSTLPLPKKPGRTVSRKTSFNHHTASKYNTVSYRKIRRGNTRQKIQDFESMVMNL